MKEPICFIDPTIVLSESLIARLRDNGLQLDFIKPSKVPERLPEVGFLLLHSFLADELLRTMESCRYIGIRAHNTDYINGEMAKGMGIDVRGLANQYGINAVAEHTMALIFSLAKNLLQSHINLAEGKWREGLAPNLELTGKKLGIVGYGKIGRRVGELGRALGMEVLIAAKAYPRNDQELPLPEVLQAADVLVVLIPGTETNRQFFNQDRLQRLKPGALFINTARGSVVDYQELERLLKCGRIGGVGLDVYPEEPVRECSIAKYPNVICTPHLAYYTREALERMNQELVDNLLDYVNRRK